MDRKHYNMMNWEEVEAVSYADTDNPFSILGIHKKGKSKLVQAFYPNADEVEAVFVLNNDKTVIKLEKVDDSGFFAAFFDLEYDSYSFNVKKEKVCISKIFDSYSFEVSLDYDAIKMILKGKSDKAYEVLGCHKKTVNTVSGYEFVLYAPSALSVSLVGDFNEWNESSNLMQRDRKNSDIFWLFVPNLEDNTEYKYVIRSKNNKVYKNDPFSFGIRNNNSLTFDISLQNEYKRKANIKDLQILEVNLFELIKKYGSGKEALRIIEDNINRFSYNTVSFTSFLYEISGRYNLLNLFSADMNTDFYDETIFVFEELKKKQIIVLLEHPISYFSRYEGGLSQFDSSFLFENEDYRLNYHRFYDALLLDYNKGISRSYVISSINYWMNVLPIDGVVLPNLGVMLYHDYNKTPGEYITESWDSSVNSVNVSLLKDINKYIHDNFKGTLTVAGINAFFENVTGKDKNSLGFDYCFNNGAGGEILEFFSLDVYSRKERLDSFLLFTERGRDNEKFILPFSNSDKERFLRIIDNFSGYDEKDMLSNLKLAVFYKHLLNNAQLSSEEIDNPSNLSTDSCKNYANFISNLRKICVSNTLFMKYSNKTAVFGYKCIENQVFTREIFDEDEKYLLVFNFSDNSYEKYDIKVSRKGVYKECFNSDKKTYGGRGIVNSKACETKDDEEVFGTITLKIPAFSVIAFTYRPFTEKELEDRYQKKKKQMIEFVEKEKNKIILKLDEDIASLKENAKKEIKELELLLKPYDR